MANVAVRLSTTTVRYISNRTASRGSELTGTGLRVECLRCGQCITVHGITDSAKRRGFALLRNTCLRRESNYYQQAPVPSGAPTTEAATRPPDPSYAGG